MLPEQFTSRMARLLGDAYPAFLAAYDQPRNAALRFNPLKTRDCGNLPFLQQPVPWAAHGYYYDPDARPGLHPYHAAGLYYLQEASAMAPAALLAPEPGQRVLDLCAAPGGKSTQLAAMMAGRGLLVCNEIHPKRAQILSSNIERMGIANALVCNAAPADLARRFPNYFDRILVDAPCSGEGMFRKEPAAVADWSPDTVAMCARRQDEILACAAQMLAPGGRLVYSTCTFAPEENEGTVSRFLHTHPDFAIVHPPAACTLFAPGRPDWIANPAPGLADTFRLWPHLLRGEGHFAAVLARRGDGDPATCALQPPDTLPASFQAFARELPSLPDGIPVQLGARLFLAPPQMPALQGLRVLRAGLELGETRKNYFLPAHALALWLPAAQATCSLPADSAALAAYLHGQTLSGSQVGWTLVQADGHGIGWAKGSGGTLKNHYPKGLRTLHS